MVSRTVLEQNKLTVNYKMEPGCLGPTGDSLVEAYCQFAQQEIEQSLQKYSFVNWLIEPRFDKSLAEISYSIAGKRLKASMVEKYLLAFQVEIDDFEDEMNEKLMNLIDQFLNR